MMTFHVAGDVIRRSPNQIEEVRHGADGIRGYTACLNVGVLGVLITRNDFKTANDTDHRVSRRP